MFSYSLLFLLHSFVQIALAPAYERCFEVTTSSRRYHLRAPTEADTQIWLQKIQDAAALTIESLYDVLELLGQGTFAKVKRGRDKATGQEFAIKIIGAQQRQITMEYSAVVD